MTYPPQGPAPLARSVKADYQSERRRRGMTLILPSREIKNRYAGMAAEAGMDLQGFILTQLSAATSGTVVPAEVLAEKNEALARLTRWYETAREEVAELRRELDLVKREREDYRVLLAQEGKLVAVALGSILEARHA